jgi:hypothetical protein
MPAQARPAAAAAPQPVSASICFVKMAVVVVSAKRW